MFFLVIDPFNLGGYNFLNSNPFLTIFSAPNASIGGFKFFLSIKNNGALLLDMACLEHLSVHSLVILPYKKSQIDFEDEMKTKQNYVVRIGHYWIMAFCPR